MPTTLGRGGSKLGLVGMPAIQALRRLRQGDRELETSLSYVVRHPSSKYEADLDCANL